MERKEEIGSGQERGWTGMEGKQRIGSGTTSHKLWRVDERGVCVPWVMRDSRARGTQALHMYGTLGSHGVKQETGFRALDRSYTRHRGGKSAHRRVPHSSEEPETP